MITTRDPNDVLKDWEDCGVYPDAPFLMHARALAEALRQTLAAVCRASGIVLTHECSIARLENELALYRKVTEAARSLRVSEEQRFGNSLQLRHCLDKAIAALPKETK